MELTLKNTRPRPLALWIEPWGDFYEVDAGGSVSIAVTGPRDQVLPSFVVAEDTVTVWAETGVSVELIAPDSGERVRYWGPWPPVSTPPEGAG